MASAYSRVTTCLKTARKIAIDGISETPVLFIAVLCLLGTCVYVGGRSVVVTVIVLAAVAAVLIALAGMFQSLNYFEWLLLRLFERFLQQRMQTVMREFAKIAERDEALNSLKDLASLVVVKILANVEEEKLFLGEIEEILTSVLTRVTGVSDPLWHLLDGEADERSSASTSTSDITQMRVYDSDDNTPALEAQRRRILDRSRVGRLAVFIVIAFTSNFIGSRESHETLLFALQDLLEDQRMAESLIEVLVSVTGNKELLRGLGASAMNIGRYAVIASHNDTSAIQRNVIERPGSTSRQDF